MNKYLIVIFLVLVGVVAFVVISQFNNKNTTLKNMPESQNKLSNKKLDELRSYIENDDIDIEDFDEDEKIVTWIDHREDDADIVRYFEGIIESGHLSAEWVDVEGRQDRDVAIEYKNIKNSIDYPGEYTDRDTTITFLNEMISDDYEIRFCKESDGNDTLAFIILENKEWSSLEDSFGSKKLNGLFAKISPGDIFFE